MNATAPQLSGWRLFGLYVVIALGRQVAHDARNLIRWARQA